MNHNIPWCVLGDFNSILSIEDRQEGVTPSTVEMEDFLACTASLGMEEAYSTGNRFTRSNGTVRTKLDRVLLSPVWHSQDLNCLVDF